MCVSVCVCVCVFVRVRARVCQAFTCVGAAPNVLRQRDCQMCTCTLHDSGTPGRVTNSSAKSCLPEQDSLEASFAAMCMARVHFLISKHFVHSG